LYGIEEIQGTDAKLTGIASVLFYNMEWNWLVKIILWKI
jgi:hypothetical protein